MYDHAADRAYKIVYAPFNEERLDENPELNELRRMRGLFFGVLDRKADMVPKPCAHVIEMWMRLA